MRKHLKQLLGALVVLAAVTFAALTFNPLAGSLALPEAAQAHHEDCNDFFQHSGHDGLGQAWGWCERLDHGDTQGTTVLSVEFCTSNRTYHYIEVLHQKVDFWFDIWRTRSHSDYPNDPACTQYGSELWVSTPQVANGYECIVTFGVWVVQRPQGSTLTVKYGDGSTSQHAVPPGTGKHQVSIDHQYPSSGTYTITATTNVGQAARPKRFTHTSEPVMP